jgi:hypothetical protein
MWFDYSEYEGLTEKEVKLRIAQLEWQQDMLRKMLLKQLDTHGDQIADYIESEFQKILGKEE